MSAKVGRAYELGHRKLKANSATFNPRLKFPTAIDRLVFDASRDRLA